MEIFTSASVNRKYPPAVSPNMICDEPALPQVKLYEYFTPLIVKPVELLKVTVTLFWILETVYFEFTVFIVAKLSI